MAVKTEERGRARGRGRGRRETGEERESERERERKRERDFQKKKYCWSLFLGHWRAFVGSTSDVLCQFAAC